MHKKTNRSNLPVCFKLVTIADAATRTTKTVVECWCWWPWKFGIILVESANEQWNFITSVSISSGQYVYLIQYLFKKSRTLEKANKNCLDLSCKNKKKCEIEAVKMKWFL